MKLLTQSATGIAHDNIWISNIREFFSEELDKNVFKFEIRKLNGEYWTKTSRHEYVFEAWTNDYIEEFKGGTAVKYTDECLKALIASAI